MLTRLPKVLMEKWRLLLVPATFWMLLGRVCGVLVSLLTSVLVARHLGPEIYGHLAYAWSFVALFQIIAALGLDEIVLAEIIKNQSARDQIIFTAMALRLFGAIFCSAAAVITVGFVTKGNETMIRLAALCCLANLGNVMLMVQQDYFARLDNKTPVIALISSMLLALIFQLCLVTTYATVEWFAFANAIQPVLAGCFLLLQAHRVKSHPWRWGAHWARILMKDVWARIINGFAVSAANYLPTTVAGLILSANMLGQFALAHRLLMAYIAIPTVVAQSIAPAFLISLKEENSDMHLRALQAMYRKMFWLGVLFAVGLAGFAFFVLPLFYGRAFDESRYLLLGLALLTPLYCVSQCRYWYIVSQSAFKYAMVMSSLSIAINILLTYFLLKGLGIWGVVVAQIATQIWNCYIQDYMSCRHRQNAQAAFRAIYC